MPPRGVTGPIQAGPSSESAYSEPEKHSVPSTRAHPVQRGAVMNASSKNPGTAMN